VLLWGAQEAERKFFRALERQLSVDWMSESRQGIYCFDPDGKMLAQEVLTKNYRDQMTRPKLVRKLLSDALLAHRKRAAKPTSFEIGVALPEGGNRWEGDFPKKGLALRVTGRDLPRDGTMKPHLWSAWGRWKPRSAINLDYAWYRSQEVRAWLPQKLTAGRKHRVPQVLVERLVRFHFLNNIRCHTALPFETDEVKLARIDVTIESIRGDSVALTLVGASHAEHLPKTKWELKAHGTSPIGFASRMIGRATWDRARGRFSAFKLVAVGERWGEEATRSKEPRTPLGFAVELADEESYDRAPPRRLRIDGPERYW
jgi:hypothetical protein